MRRLSLRCDPLAPIYAFKEDVAHWKATRTDLIDLAKSNDYDKHAKTYAIIRDLTQRYIEEERRRYFQEADRRRALGQSTDDLLARDKSVAGSGEKACTAEAIAALFELDSQQRPSPGQGRETTYIELLVAYLDDTQTPEKSPQCFLCLGLFKTWAHVWKHSVKAHCSKELWPLSCPECARLGVEESLDQIANLGEWSVYVHEHHAPRDEEPYRCLLGYRTFDNRADLIKHLIQRHNAFETITKPFPYPEYYRLGIVDCYIRNITEFRQYIESRHDPKHLLTLSASHTCLLCENQVFQTRTGLSNHITTFHVYGQQTFDRAFPYPECCRLSYKDYTIHSLAEWCVHVANRYGKDNTPNPPPSSRLLCLLYNKPVYNERKHFLTKHLNASEFENPFSCPEYVRQGASSVPLIQDCSDWHLHCAAVHGKIAPPMVAAGKCQKTLTRCLVCNGYFKAIASRFTRKHVKQGLFSQPLQCPECSRMARAGKPIKNWEEWVVHCAAVHGDTSFTTVAQTESANKRRKEMRLIEKMAVEDVQQPQAMGPQKRGRVDTSESPGHEPKAKARRVGSPLLKPLDSSRRP